MNRYALIGIMIFIAIAIFFWFFWPTSQKQEPETAPPIVVQTPQSYEPARRSFNEGGIESRKNLQEKQSFRFFDTIAPLVEPFEELIPSADNIKMSLRGAPPLRGDEAIPLSSAGLPRSSSKSSDSLAPHKSLKDSTGLTMTNKKKVPTEQEIFDWIWPQAYREDLAALETLYKREGYIASRASTNFSEENNIYQFLAETLDVSQQQGWLAPPEAVILRKGLIETLPTIIERDKEMLRQGILPVSYIPKDASIEKLRWVLFANIANASPGWVTDDDCYKDDDPDNKTLGPNIWAECCNCGLFCTPTGCARIQDCGEKSKKCNVPLGCLNLVCENFPNAIWDPKGICGCG